MNEKQIAKELLEQVGSINNIESVAHCATRLRLELKDNDLITREKLEMIEGIKGIVYVDGQYQIILGPGFVNKIYAEVIQLLGTEEFKPKEPAPKGIKSSGILQRFIRLISDIFIPIIPTLIAAGFLLGIVNLCIYPGYFFEDKALIDAYPNLSGIANMLSIFANSVFIFLPVLIGYSATKRFGGNPFVGALLGLIMVHPSLVDPSTGAQEIPTWNFFGLLVEQEGYQYTVLPVLVASYILSKLEISLRKKFHDSVALFIPMITITVTATLTFIIIGPIMRVISDSLVSGAVWLYDTTGLFGGIALGLLYAPLVVTGMHHIFIPVEAQLIATTGGTFILPMAAMSNVAQGAAGLAIWYLIKNKRTKGEALIGGVTSVLGSSEPIMFGINLKFRYPFYAALIASAIGGAFMALTRTNAIGMGAGGLAGIILYRSEDMLTFIAGMIGTFLIAFLLTVVFSRKNKRKQER
ncbi:PTS system, sucrose-specific IIC component [Evansella caseinilytica]|uniref:PTS system, sucrose-specific IIC component n=1 Tax=Evansella caseinilytica TaxID=1503961 RepID=A0A1H3SCU0_9BACI|nr:PTS transporter subunit EIIC [Evansella caseinilytica]SDZ35724.1 PTS system, sucrose-specific IIC component [Evansella caseinilytica]